jgi:predicted unusual protein kinase regulating ubiquinone biosynthesis (AarF/ABC1/UbiB family)
MYRARYRRIVFFFARIITSIIFWDLILARLGLRRWVQRTRPKRLQNIASRYRELAVQMGGVLIKVGQFLSSRVDVLPKEITTELSGLQDEVPPEDFREIQIVAEKELGGKLTDVFANFETQPLAAASLGQVHRAELNPSYIPTDMNLPEKVVVKIQRPDIETIIATDIAALTTVGDWLKRYPPISRRADVPALLKEFTRVLYEEIDYLAEGHNAEIFADNFSNREGVRVPVVVWNYTTKKVLTLEDVFAIKITDYQAITDADIDRAEVAERLLDTYLKQIFEDHFFHADPHPGNLFVSPIPYQPASEGLTSRSKVKQRNWQLTFVDFGMVGRVPPNLRSGMRELVIAVGTQDAARVVKAYQLLGMLLPHANLELIERAEARAFEKFWGKSMSELQQISLDEMQEFASEFREIIYSLPFQVPSDILFLVRCVAILSGMCTGLNPNFNVWGSLAPYAEHLIAEEAEQNWEYWFSEVSTWARELITLPRRLNVILTKIERGEIEVQIPHLSTRLDRLTLANQRLVWMLFFTALFLGGIQLVIANQTLYGGLMLVVAILSLGRILFVK